MKKMLQRSLSTILALLIVFSSGICALAQESQTEQPGEWHTLDAPSSEIKKIICRGTTDNIAEVTVYGTLVGDYFTYDGQVPWEITVCREYDIVSVSAQRIPNYGTIDVPLGATLEEIYHQLETKTVDVTLKSTSGETKIIEGVTFQFERSPEDRLTELGEHLLVAYPVFAENAPTPQNLEKGKIEVVVKTRTYDLISAQSVRLNVPLGTAYEALDLPPEAPMKRQDGEIEYLPATWKKGSYNPNRSGNQVIRGTLELPLPLHITNSLNKQPNAIVNMPKANATLVSLQPVPQVALFSEETEQIEGLKEYQYIATYQNDDGTVSKEPYSLFIEE